MKTIKDLGDVRGKRVLVRSDLNVPLDGKTITDAGRITASLPTLIGAVQQGAELAAQLRDLRLGLREGLRVVLVLGHGHEELDLLDAGVEALELLQGRLLVRELRGDLLGGLRVEVERSCGRWRTAAAR